ncbi:MAG: phosphoenolpyruvate synthase regulatory protein [Micavibrio sp. TMED27]|nr:phosphoenolpyruvate synthase regulatory protein [Micavibrio sp.]OUT92473.1 MAG: phosphoenolpyruvate synthase regulatory protein [Micavibrio sp. TMED27]|tara:strand:- start:494 stop:1381 length:888 start_codon:yes stop_codon:yes gene_type:complete
MSKDKRFHIHLVSDATGTTLLGLARACLAQFEHIDPVQKFWPLVRTKRQLERVITQIKEKPGPVIFTFVDNDMRLRLQESCEEMGVPCVAVLDPIIRSLSSYIGEHAKGVPGLQHAMDDAYFKRVEAVDYAMSHDDGKTLKGLSKADVILVGVSRTSKTPTSIFLARRGIKAANIPLVPGVEVPDEKLSLVKPMYVGLIASSDRLMQLRRSRLKAGEKGASIHIEENRYLDVEEIDKEIKKARRLYSKKGWPVIDVTKRSIEETAAEIMALLQRQRDNAKKKKKEQAQAVTGEGT